jgi:16S rRNA (uracil1498-N3)-methyltransferase
MEKATELGVREVFPIFTDNCAVARDVLTKKVEKWQKVMYEASKQCERAKIPLCNEISDLKTVLKKDFDKVLVLAERSTEISLKEFLNQNQIKKGEKVLVIIGPEGGFSQNEFDFFKSKNLPLISLGDLILKAETAVIVTLGNIVYEYKG